MKKTISIIILLLIAFIMFAIVSCNTYQKQLRTYQAFGIAHPDQSAILCAQLFPVKDSIGGIKIDSSHLSHNINYLNQIDSLKSLVDALSVKNSLDTSKTNPCAPIAKKYQTDVHLLQTKIDALKNVYKPCKPDTIYSTKTVFRTDEAALKVEQGKTKIANDSLVFYKNKLKEETATAHNWRKYALIAIGIITLSIIGTILKILGKI